MKRKRSKNLSISPRLLEVAEGYCETSNRRLAPYVEELLREDLRGKGYPVDASPEEIMLYLAGLRKKETKKETKTTHRLSKNKARNINQQG